MAVVRGGCGGAGGMVALAGTRWGAEPDRTESCIQVSKDMFQQRAQTRQQG